VIAQGGVALQQRDWEGSTSGSAGSISRNAHLHTSILTVLRRLRSDLSPSWFGERRRSNRTDRLDNDDGLSGQREWAVRSLPPAGYDHARHDDPSPAIRLSQRRIPKRISGSYFTVSICGNWFSVISRRLLIMNAHGGETPPPSWPCRYPNANVSGALQARR